MCPYSLALQGSFLLIGVDQHRHIAGLVFDSAVDAEAKCDRLNPLQDSAVGTRRDSRTARRGRPARAQHRRFSVTAGWFELIAVCRIKWALSTLKSLPALSAERLISGSLLLHNPAMGGDRQTPPNSVLQESVDLAFVPEKWT